MFSIFFYVAHVVLFKEAVHITWQLLRRPSGRRSCHGQVEAEDTMLDPHRGVRKVGPRHTLHNATARVLFLGRLVEHFALLAEGATLLHELIEVFTALEYRVDRVVQHDLGIIQFLLHAQDRVSLTGVLVPRKVVLLSLIHISEPTRPRFGSRMPSSA